MPIGIGNWTQNMSLENITSVVQNITDPTEILININHQVYNGWLYFILLLTLWIILFLIAWNQSTETKNFHDLSVYLMYSGAMVSIISFFLRAIYVVKEGIYYGLLTDFQMWLFPLITIILATFAWMTRE